MTWRQLIGYITTRVIEFSRLLFGSAASVSSDETQVFLRLSKSKGDQHEFCLNNIQTSSREKVRRSNKMMNKGEEL